MSTTASIHTNVFPSYSFTGRLLIALEQNPSSSVRYTIPSHNPQIFLNSLAQFFCFSRERYSKQLSILMLVLKCQEIWNVASQHLQYQVHRVLQNLLSIRNAKWVRSYTVGVQSGLKRGKEPRDRRTTSNMSGASWLAFLAKSQKCMRTSPVVVWD